MTNVKSSLSFLVVAPIVAIFISLLATPALSEVPFNEHPNGDLTIKVAKITKKHLDELVRDIPGKQGLCVRFAVMEFQEYENTSALMRIPDERHGIEFEPRGDGMVQIICGRFTEDQFDGNGKPISSLEYTNIEGY